MSTGFRPTRARLGEHRPHLLVRQRVARPRVPGSMANATPITSPLPVDQRAARVAGLERRREHVDVPPARRRAVDVGADREDLLADLRR